ncbi:alpha/beta hydrolase fold domain-containing protein [Streptomyces roseoverticillatus]|uniref:Alpha/beta hydrolase fold domain-containing protein n=1 Tax=Streptomyces roseoverticillatus TaxID=66429 RepID=A0ABV3J4H5_9ACTN
MTPNRAQAVRDRLGALFADPARLPADAEVSGDWVRAPGAGDGAVVYVHGGGFAHTMPEAERVMAYRLSKATARPVLRVDYRPAPAHPYPAALEDVLAAWRSVLDQGAPAAKIVLVGEFTVSTPEAGPYALAEGPDGALWFTLTHQGAIGRTGADGHLTVHPTRAGTGPTITARGPDDALWFTEYRAHRIGRIAVDGTVTSCDSYDLSSPTCEPHGIASSGGALWCALEAGSLARIEVSE